MGFADTMNAIIENLPKKRQTLLFSATQTKSVKDLARLSLKDPEYVWVHEKAKFRYVGIIFFFFFGGGAAVKQIVILLNCLSDCQFPESEVRLCIFFLPIVSDPVVCLPESKGFPDKRVLVLTESLQGGQTRTSLVDPQAASQTGNLFPQEQALVWIIASVA